MSTNGKVSFTVRRPSPVSRASSAGHDSDFKKPALPSHLTGSAHSSAPGSPLRHESPKPKSRTYHERDSSDEDAGIEDELVTGFDQFGVQRLHEKKKPQGPLVIPALKNKDWRELARKRKNLYVPPSAAAETGADGSVGGLGTKDTINSGPQLSGIQQRKRVKVEEDAMQIEVEETIAAAVAESVPKEEETEDQKAIRALIANASGEDGGLNGPVVDIIPAATEDDAYRQDVEELPEPATLDDYERVPVSQFGAALLRGMGWKEGTAASRKGKGPVEPWLPTARPALLGIGAKEKEVFDDGSQRKKKTFVDKRYIPVIKKERRDDKEHERDRDSRSGTSSRKRSLSPRESQRPSSTDRRRDHDRHDVEGRDRRRDRDRGDGRDRERTHDTYVRDERYEGRDRKRDSDYRDVDSDPRRHRDRESNRHGDRSVDKDRDRSDSRHRDRDRR
ncbi:hypothetical protein BDW22DRAFT_1358817 [Trametopsis cervina]|nr:hypothetical protein BDW22DRAFT_1358817 [Trametopsis cervina]